MGGVQQQLAAMGGVHAVHDVQPPDLLSPTAGA